MDRIWFIFHQSEVSGPFTSEEIKSQTEAGRWRPDDLIWWRGQKEWTGLKAWLDQLPQILEARRQSGNRIQWFGYSRSKKRGPMAKSELVSWIRSLPPSDISEMRIWTDTTREWKSVFDFHEIALELGMNARKTPRAGIFGFVTFSESNLVYQMSTIGAGGFGLESAKDLLTGQVYTVTIKSPLLVNPIHATAEVRYVSPSGQCGFHFTQIGMESISLIMDYVRQYRDTNQHIADSIEAEANGNAPKLWYLARNGQQEGPYTHGDLVQMLQWIEDRTDVSLWTEGMQHWASLFEFTDILEQTGLSRRAGHRAPIQGEIAVLAPAPGGRFAAASISITGCGFHGDGSIRPEQEIEANIHSESLGAPIYFKGTVRYVDATGYVGVEFQNMSGEVRKRIADYVQPFHPNQFTDETTQTNTKVAA